MYSQGETFYYDIDGDDYELTVLENLVLEDKEYIVAEDFDGDLHVFSIDEDDEELYLVEDKKEFRMVVDYWKEECLLDEDISDFDDDPYYDREEDEIEKFDDEMFFDDELGSTENEEYL
ncbi:MAG: DUF1292 domain-containing protein [Fusobacterium sp.]|nr:DUF1292 domain-containing protein [Fusobacterium sp.]